MSDAQRLQLHLTGGDQREITLMRDKLLLAGTAAVLMAFPAFAQTGAAVPPPVNAPPTGATAGTAGAAGRTTTDMPPPVNPAPTTPPGSAAQSTTGATASTGTAANTSAIEASLRTGAVVRDSAGVEIGRISKVTRGGAAGAETQVTLSSGGKSVSIPASSLSMSEGALVTSQTKADIWGPR